MPPLRRRKEDIVPLAEMFIEKYSHRYNKGELCLSDEAKVAITEHTWEGNIRELQHTIEKAVIMADNRYIELSELMLKTTQERDDLMCSTLEEMERKMIAEAISTSDGNMTTVAQKLGITRQTLYNKIKRYGL